MSELRAGSASMLLPLSEKRKLRRPTYGFSILHSDFLQQDVVAVIIRAVMNLEEQVEVVCPYCGAIYTSFVDTLEGTFSTIEDCEICCRPIEIHVACHAGRVDSFEAMRA
jgi:hypothetical protein